MLHNARQREEERTPKTGSPTLQNLPGLPEDLRLIVEEIKQGMLELLGDQALKRTLGPKDPWAAKWRGVLSRYPRILIIGAQGTGKFCLVY